MNAHEDEEARPLTPEWRKRELEADKQRERERAYESGTPKV
jgi:hypothetical protein